MLAATGEMKYADRLERAVFNAAPGAIGPQFRTIQYFSAPNQVIAASNSTFIDCFADTPRFAYQPHHYPECCVGNVGRIFPGYIARMYMEFDGGIYFMLYGDSVYSSDGITVEQSGNYPFSDGTELTVACAEPREKTFCFRIPGWSDGCSLKINGITAEYINENGYAVIRRKWENNDKISLTFNKKLTQGVTSDNGIYFEYGPFLLALPIKERWEKDENEKRQTKDFPAYNVYPESCWNYAVSRNAAERARIEKAEMSGFSSDGSCHFAVLIPARALEGWKLINKSINKSSSSEEQIDEKMVELGATQITEELVLTPPIPKTADTEKLSDEEYIRLVPYGCTNLRISVFPQYR